MNFLFSIIIPVYNTEKYLPRCLDSIVNQKVKDIEIIIVNDCSPGNCKAVVEEYQKRYNNIKYIALEENKGTLVARDAGIKACKSEYIMFLDPDDYLMDNNILSELSKEIKYDYDIIAFNYLCENENGERFESPPQNKITENEIIYNGLESVNEIFNGSISESLPSKLIKKKLYNKHISSFNRHIVFQEDYLVFIKLAYNAKKIKLITLDVFVYFQREDSSTKFKNMSFEKKKKTLEDLAYVNKEVYRFLKENSIFKKFKRDVRNREYSYKEWIYSEIMPNTNNVQKKELEVLFSKVFTNIKKTDKLFSVVKTNRYVTVNFLGIKISIKIKS